MSAWESLNRQIVACERCQRLRRYCRTIAKERKKAFQAWEYWGRPVPNFGDPHAKLLVVGLAPAAHGGNRTGRVFTGDRSGDWLYRALYRAGFANQPTSTARDDGLELIGCAVTAVAHCAPPANRPTPGEIANCQPWLAASIDLLPAQVFVALGQIAWRAILAEARRRGWFEGRMPKFGHGALVRFAHGRSLLASYHPSQQNTFTGRLTEPMFDAIFRQVRELFQGESPKRKQR